MRDSDVASQDTFTREVIFDSNVFGVGMPDMVLREMSGSVVIAE